VVKADAYGLGMAAVAPALARAGARSFFVALPEEGLRLRRLLPEAEIAVLNGLFPGAERDYAAHALVPVLNDLDEIARWQGEARRAGQRLPAMLHVDTGMNRLGMDEVAIEALAAAPDRLDGLAVTAVLSHFACADDADDPMSAAQAAAFGRLKARLPAARASLCNSPGCFRDPAWRHDLVRPGIAVYGGNPTPEAANPMRPVVRLEAQIVQVRRVDSPMTVGYGATHRIREPGKLATISIGYADGYRRILGGRARVGLGGRRCPVVGRVSMDLTTIDVSDVDEAIARPGAWVSVIDETDDIDRLAAAADTIPYEILTGLGQRFERVHLGDGAPPAAPAEPGRAP
jgi:alanine racemase